MNENPFASPPSHTQGVGGGQPDHSPGLHPLQAAPAAPPSSESSTAQSQHLFISPNQPVYSNVAVTDHSASAVTGKNSKDSNDVRESARKTYRNHGSGVTQTLEEIRRQDESQVGSVTARIVGANTERRDFANNRYTSYIILVKSSYQQQQQAPAPASTEIEHRYSEFSKLHDLLERHNVKIYESNGDRCSNNIVTFPSKSLSGRLGNWTPSRRWAPNAGQDLVEYRKRQLDVWLTHVCHTYNNDSTVGTSSGSNNVNMTVVLPPSVRNAIDDFLSPIHSSAHTSRPPCDLDNYDYGEIDNVDIQCHDQRQQQQQQQQQQPQTSSSSTFSVNNPIAFTLGKSIRQACCIVHDMCYIGPVSSAAAASAAAAAASSSSGSHLGPALSSTNSNSNTTAVPSAVGIKEHDQSIPLDLLRAARGLMFLTVIKAGVVVSARAGTGLLVARLDAAASADSSGGGNSSSANSPEERSSPHWSAPCAIGTVGMGWGMLAGGEVSNYLIVLTTDEAVDSIIGGTQVQLGTEIGMAVGPVGRGTKVDVSTNGSNNTNKIVPLPSLHP
eukprot:CAMPEP_0113491598 /NCGR_PEP_ID=MMETSP0014_2-20120614/27637_1 /TAXON_ID=2857 /ORGANISM="Nitzschia sp." /LENGTH=555 /DNA_ID=CAMNT_0000385391 /DNA_START=59 /DNA_END=1722 /DNA_ORIENTATION=- /assembly_acc=CAM_ASM_000159